MQTVIQEGRYSYRITLSDRNSKVQVILQNGFFEPDKGTDFSHNHTLGEFFVPMGDKGVIWINNKTLILRRGEICYVRPLVDHYIIIRNKDESVVRFNVDFSRPGGSNSFFHFIYHYFMEAKEYEVFSLSQAAQIMQLCVESAQAYPENMEQIVVGLMTAFFGSLSSVIRQNAREAFTEKKLTETREKKSDLQTEISWYFSYNFSSNANVEDLAKRINYSVRQTDRIINAIFGKSFSQMLIESRIRHSMKLMQNELLTLGEVASLVGYRSYKGYYCAFRQKTGVSPSEYRTKLQDDVLPH